MDDKKRTASDAIMEFINWTEFEEGETKVSDYERGVKFGIMIAQQIAKEVECNG